MIGLLIIAAGTIAATTPPAMTATLFDSTGGSAGSAGVVLNTIGGSSTAFDFTPTLTGVASSADVYVWMSTTGATDPAFTFSLYADASGMPGTLLSQGSGSANLSMYELTPVNLNTPVLLTAGTTYWAAVSGVSTSPLQSLAWTGQSGTPLGSYQIMVESSGVWTPSLPIMNREFPSLRLNIPEPSRALLMSLSLVALAGRRSRKN